MLSKKHQRRSSTVQEEGLTNEGGPICCLLGKQVHNKSHCRITACTHNKGYTNRIWGGCIFERNITTLENVTNSLFEEPPFNHDSVRICAELASGHLLAQLHVFELVHSYYKPQEVDRSIISWGVPRDFPSEIAFEVCLPIVLNLASSQNSLYPTCNLFYRIA